MKNAKEMREKIAELMKNKPPSNPDIDPDGHSPYFFQVLRNTIENSQRLTPGWWFYCQETNTCFGPYYDREDCRSNRKEYYNQAEQHGYGPLRKVDE